MSATHFSGPLVVGDTITASGSVTVTGDITASGLVSQGTGSVEALVAATTLTSADNGKVLFLNHATGFATTLPAPAAGLRFKFVVTTQPTTGNDTIVTNGGDNVIEGMADVNSTLVLAANEDSINIVASTAIVGDWVEVVSDGTSWFVNGASGAAGGITFTAT